MGTGRSSTPSGILVGHSEGITYVTSKGDNRYLASNGKDQKMLLWDLRMMYSKQDFEKLPKVEETGFDYRSDLYTKRKSYKLPVWFCSKCEPFLENSRVSWDRYRCHESN